MSLSALLAEAITDLKPAETAPVSTKVETLSTVETPEVIDSKESFHSFHSFHPYDANIIGERGISTKTDNEISNERARAAYPSKTVERVETVETGVKNPIVSIASFFPLNISEVERVEREGHPAGSLPIAAPSAPRLSSNAARSGWADVDKLLVPYEREIPTGVDLWRQEIAVLNRLREPCPGWRAGSWPWIFDAVQAFLDRHADRAFALGWTAIELFGVNRIVGAANVADCGALMLGSATVIDVTKDHVLFERMRFPRWEVGNSSVLVWEFGR